jgi:outer membrane protein assembly factor BamD (BamD/ComL family)
MLLLGLGAALSNGCQTTGGAGRDVATGGPGDPAGGQSVVRASLWERMDPFAAKSTPPPASESFTLRPEGLVADKAPKEGAESDLAGARELFRAGDFAAAEPAFRKIAENTKNPVNVAEEARFYEAECLRNQLKYPKAADTYADCVTKFPQGAHREQALQRMYDIANYWLDDTRAEMEEWKEKEEGKRVWVWPRVFSIEKTKPFLDREGRAVEKLEQVRLNDINGPLADKALFICGSVRLYKQDYREADQYFSDLCERHPNSPLAPQAMELAIFSKQMSTGGSDYDGRKAAEARKLVQTAMDTYPELAGPKKDYLMKQLVSITLQQCEKDFKVAEFYRKKGHAGAAYFYYGIVVRTYKDIEPYYSESLRRMEELKAKAAKDGAPPPAAGPQVAQAPPPPARQAEAAPPPRPLAPAPNGLVPGQ